nr:hypothetical protein [Tanacetum cinerariifolium]
MALSWKNLIPPDHVDDLPVVEPNQSDVVPVISEYVLVDEDEDPEEKEFKEEDEPQEEEEDMEVDIEEDDNETELLPFQDDCNEMRSSTEEGAVAMENLVRKLGNAEEKAECKTLKKELEEARFSNTLLSMQKERVKRDLYWTRVQAHEFYREMIRRGVVFKERLNEAIDVPVEDEVSPSSDPNGSPRDS